MKLQTVAARQGAQWVRLGFRTFFKRPMAFAALFATFMFAVFALTLVPVVGSLAVLSLMPLVCLGFMIATRRVLDGGLPTPQVYVEPLRAARPRVMALLRLGAAYAVATFAVMWISDLSDGGSLQAVLDALPESPGSTDSALAKLADADLLWGLALRFGLAAVLSVPFWHAPALIYWEGQGCAQSLFSSTLAVWRNRAAFAVYGVTWVGAVTALCMAGALVVQLIGQAQYFEAAAVPLSLLLTSVFYTGLYFTYADCFVAGAQEPRVATA